MIKDKKKVDVAVNKFWLRVVQLLEQVNFWNSVLIQISKDDRFKMDYW